ncbi:MAG TPA: hypothetical protein VFO94_09460, partial [Gammaproteobacteria bacterium]|nr:hypothetical protein [Gammaproteobacteria bacterium]
ARAIDPPAGEVSTPRPNMHNNASMKPICLLLLSGLLLGDGAIAQSSKETQAAEAPAPKHAVPYTSLTLPNGLRVILH